MPIQAHGGHDNQIRNVNDTKPDHGFPRREFRSHFFRKVEGVEECDDGGEEEPLSHGIAEEEQSDEFGRVGGPADDDETDEEAGVHRHEVVADFTDGEERDDAVSFVKVSFAVGWVGPGERFVFPGCLGPALRPSETLFPECVEGVGGHFE